VSLIDMISDVLEHLPLIATDKARLMDSLCCGGSLHVKVRTLDYSFGFVQTCGLE